MEYYVLQNRLKYLVVLDRCLKVIFISSVPNESEELAKHLAENFADAFQKNKISFELPPHSLPYRLRGLRAPDQISENSIRQTFRSLVY